MQITSLNPATGRQIETLEELSKKERVQAIFANGFRGAAEVVRADLRTARRPPVDVIRFEDEGRI